MDTPQITPSALQDLITKSTTNNRYLYSNPEDKAYHSLALQVSHNLRYQHNWADIRIHHPSTSTSLKRALPRPLISGIPRKRLYVHPDEQIALLQQQKDTGKTGLPDLQPEREWVLPSHLREKWSLRRFGEVFDTITPVPEMASGEEVFPDPSEEAEKEAGGGDEDVSDEGADVSEWRSSLPKRVLLATVDDDSTITYYIVHDGVVKPRQN